jgi:hypothetical protein
LDCEPTYELKVVDDARHLPRLPCRIGDRQRDGECPTIDLIELTGMRYACSPSARSSATIASTMIGTFSREEGAWR